MTTFRGLIEGVEENNRINDGRWVEWKELAHVEGAYGDLGDEDVSREEAEGIIGRAIASDGATLANDLRVIELRVWGQNFAGSWWNREVGA
jgi:hypothetical protein